MATSTKVSNKNKATHSGTCQICGSGQKLPSGVLSKHGYTTRWGFFSGVCNGAGHLPFEQSCDLIQAAIRSAEAMIVTTTEQIAEVRKQTGTKAWVHYYDGGRHSHKAGYRWVECEVVERHIVYATGYEHDKVVYVNPYGKDEQTGNYGADQSVAGTVKNFNERDIASVLQTRIGQLKQYIEWQKGRIAGWKPAELTPVK